MTSSILSAVERRRDRGREGGQGRGSKGGGVREEGLVLAFGPKLPISSQQKPVITRNTHHNADVGLNNVRGSDTFYI